MNTTLLSAHLGLAWATYIVNTASPGPSNMAIMGMAMNAGRRPALWLAYKSGRSACQADAPPNTTTAGKDVSARALYLRGTAMHLTNPKAILSWLAIVTLALPPGARRLYAASRRWFESLLAAVFGLAGLQLLRSSAHAH
ncbi:hypothetical protein [uncultured Rhodoferax sp.]|uniref:hypothetical protein n=1 Tax=uncultured Rhodoferax sp. TaxID=223188 RepID=UPI0025E21E15|nr:hypothetical protein [uncultured Rhodoferax sp.]